MARAKDVSLWHENTPFYVPAPFVDTTKNRKKLPVEVLFLEDSPLLRKSGIFPALFQYRSQGTLTEPPCPAVPSQVRVVSLVPVVVS